MNKTIALSLVATLGIAACANNEINQPPVPYRATQKLNEVGTSSFSVFTSTKVDGRTKRVSGVPCTFEGAGFKSTFASPAVVISPNMQGRTPVASVTCVLNGEKKTQVIQPVNMTVNNINNNALSAGASAGIVGLLVGGAVAAVQASSRDVSQDVYGYPGVDIVFEGTGTAK